MRPLLWFFILAIGFLVFLRLTFHPENEAERMTLIGLINTWGAVAYVLLALMAEDRFL